MWAYRNFKEILTLGPAWKKDGRCLEPGDLGLLKNGSVVFSRDQILWCGEDKNFPVEYQNLQTHHFPNKILVPELVDCHTHLIFGGDRASEYVQRLNGISYETLAQQGGGILHTMRETRALNSSELKKLAKQRLNNLSKLGVGTVEIKSGYGLSFEKEFELSRTIFELQQEYKKDRNRIRIFNTFMAAHAVPREFSSSKEYLDQVVSPLLIKLSKERLIDAVDIFHEKGHFTTNDTRRLFTEARQLGLNVKIHADEFNDNGGAKIACEFSALSADHLLKTSEEGARALANSSTVAVLLPGTGHFLGKEQAKGKNLLDLGAKVAIATDYNPGSCHFYNLLFLATLSAPQYKMNQTQLWSAITLNAAHALGMHQQGAIVPGLLPRLGFFTGPSLDHITYHWGENLFDAQATDDHYDRIF